VQGAEKVATACLLLRYLGMFSRHQPLFDWPVELLLVLCFGVDKAKPSQLKVLARPQGKDAAYILLLLEIKDAARTLLKPA
jgi:hypothetical protein